MQKKPRDIPKTPPAESKAVNQSMTVREWSLIGLLSVIWGGSFLFIEIAVAEITPFTIVFFRVGTAALILLGYMLVTGRKIAWPLPLWGSFFVMGALNNVIPFSLIVWGQQYIDSSLASILNATTPIFSVFLAAYLTKAERLTGNRVTGIIIGWIGVAILIGVDSLKGVGAQTFGQLAILGASLSYALAAVYAKRLRHQSPLTVATGMLCASTVLSLPLALLLEQPWQLSPGMTAIGALVGLTVVSTALAYRIYFRVLASAGATNAVLVTFLVPVSAILLGVIVLGERPGWNAYAGMALIFIGLTALDGRLLTRFRQRN